MSSSSSGSSSPPAACEQPASCVTTGECNAMLLLYFDWLDIDRERMLVSSDRVVLEDVDRIECAISWFISAAWLGGWVEQGFRGRVNDYRRQARTWIRPFLTTPRAPVENASRRLRDALGEQAAAGSRALSLSSTIIISQRGKWSIRDHAHFFIAPCIMMCYLCPRCLETGCC